MLQGDAGGSMATWEQRQLFIFTTGFYRTVPLRSPTNIEPGPWRILKLGLVLGLWHELSSAFPASLSKTPSISFDCLQSHPFGLGWGSNWFLAPRGLFGRAPGSSCRAARGAGWPDPSRASQCCPLVPSCAQLRACQSASPNFKDFGISMEGPHQTVNAKLPDV